MFLSEVQNESLYINFGNKSGTGIVFNCYKFGFFAIDCYSSQYIKK